MRSEGYSTRSVCLCVCVCACSQQLTFHVFIRATNDTNLYVFSPKMLRCKARAFPVGTAYGRGGWKLVISATREVAIIAT